MPWNAAYSSHTESSRSERSLSVLRSQLARTRRSHSTPSTAPSAAAASSVRPSAASDGTRVRSTIVVSAPMPRCVAKARKTATKAPSTTLTKASTKGATARVQRFMTSSSNSVGTPSTTSQVRSISGGDQSARSATACAPVSDCGADGNAQASSSSAPIGAR